MLEQFAKYIRHSSYSVGEIERTGVNLGPWGGVEWEHTGDDDGTSESTEEG